MTNEMQYQSLFEQTKLKITAVDTRHINQANQRLDSLVKPPRSLGHLEDLAARLSAIGGKIGHRIEKRCVLVCASDNGVVAEGVSSAPQVVTALQTLNILNGVAGVSVLARQFKTDLIVVDLGIVSDIEHPDLIMRKIAYSTGNIAKERAMTAEQAARAIETGIELVNALIDQGYQAIGIGEMGIGNTTTSSAVLAVLLDLPLSEIGQTVGRGAGLTDQDFEHKIAVIRQAIQVNQPNRHDVVDILAKVGGFDLAAMTGAYLGAAARRIPVAIDGFISVVAALCAVHIEPLVRDYLFASHESFERGYALAISALDLTAPLKLDMRLGEGSGCPLLFALMDAASTVIADMATLSGTGIELDYSNDVNF
ncbi:MAG: nicotinate-nucleotide--dimethylbenzimidazole phosphoribosyltransferase [Eubacteriales bacterium]|nr:nicotinate-nucleotide--dimethylbenzimidazole phosphoribosyltransferase [Eubacteriales bacterium]